MITSRADLQPLLLQVIIGSRKRFTYNLMTSIGRVPAPVDVIKKDTAWNNGKGMLQILSHLSDALSHIDNKQIILIMGTAKCHISPKVIECATALGIWLCIVPTDATWLLQPLDVRTFQPIQAISKKRVQGLSD